MSIKEPRCQHELCGQCASNSGCTRSRLNPPTSTEAYGEGFYKRLIDNLYDAVYFVDPQRRITYWNRAAEQLTGYTAAEVVGRQCSDNLLVHTDGNGVGLCLAGCPLAQAMLDAGPQEADLYLRHKSGHRVPVSVRVAPILDSRNQIVGAVEVFSENTAKRDAEQKVAQLEQMAFLDCLTRVPNRRFLDLRLTQILEESRRYGHAFGLMLMDVDHFKHINDRYGHAVGDAALIVTAQTLTRSLRAVDNVGRWGGDEFMAILPEVCNDGLRTLAERCRLLVEQSIVAHPDGDVRIQVSIGGTLLGSADSLESVLRRADAKLYESKNQGRSRVTVG